jgi:hypothetical protein
MLRRFFSQGLKLQEKLFIYKTLIHSLIRLLFLKLQYLQSACQLTKVIRLYLLDVKLNKILKWNVFKMKRFKMKRL